MSLRRKPHHYQSFEEAKNLMQGLLTLRSIRL
jgi:hypothetical protein